MSHPAPFADWWDKPRRPRVAKPKPAKALVVREVKACNTCGQVLPLSAYHASARHRDGHTGRCKTCQAEYRRALRPQGPGAVRGEAHYNAKLTAHDVHLIKQLVSEREHLLEQARRLTNQALAEKFEVSRQTIEKIISGERWADLP